MPALRTPEERPFAGARSAAELPARSASPERPLTQVASLRLAAALTVLLLLGYLYFLSALALIAALFAVDLLVLIGATRFGLSGFMKSPLKAQLGLFGRVARSLNLERGAEFRIALRRVDAPALFDLSAAVAQDLGVSPPDEILLEMSDNAWVRLRGYRAGRGHCALGLGFDLLTVLTEGELAAVLAHEMAHARLTQRGHAGWLRNGVARLARLAQALQPWASPAKGRRFFTAEILSRGARRLAKLGCRLLAALSRQEEFAADRLAAEAAGSAVYARALTALHLTAIKGEGLHWRDRLIQLQREGSFVEWVRAGLAVRDEDEWTALEQRELEAGRRDEFSSHPALRDRLAALADASPGEEGPGAASSGRSAVYLLTTPETTVAALAAEIERVAASEERKESERLRRWVRGERRQRLAHLRARTFGEGLAMVSFALSALAALGGFVMLGVAASDRHPSTELVPAAQGLSTAAVLLALGIFLMRVFGYRERERLPVPPFAAWEGVLRRRPMAAAEGATDGSPNAQCPVTERLEAEARGRVPSGWGYRRARARLYGRAAYEALGQSDYARARSAARLCLEACPSSPEGRIAGGVAAAYFGDLRTTNQLLGQAADATSVGPSLSTALAWARILARDWPNGEAFLHDALGHRPEAATLWSLLGLCQWRQGRTREAAQSVRLAISREPDVAEHRVLLLRLLLASGHIRDAAEVLAWLEAAGVRNASVQEASVRVHLLAGQTGQARDRADQWETGEPSAETRLRLAYAYVEAKDPESARRYFQRVRESGYCPEALVGLARLAADGGDLDQARALLLGSLDLTRPTLDGARSPLELIGTVLPGLASLRAVTEGCRAGTAEVDLTGTPVTALDEPPVRLTLTVFAASRDVADALICELYAALFPGASLPAGGARWRPPAAVDPLPKAMRPGAYDCHFS